MARSFFNAGGGGERGAPVVYDKSPLCPVGPPPPPPKKKKRKGKQKKERERGKIKNEN